MNIDTSRLQFDEKKHAYKLDGKLLSGVTTVISGTSAKDNLIQWAANMAVDYVAERWTWQTHFHQGEIDEVLKEARKAHTRRRDKAASTGTDTHALVEEYILASIKASGMQTVPFHESIKPFVFWSMENHVEFLAAEQRLYSETHGYAGTCDFIAMIDGKLTIGDLKTFPKMWSADAFIQCAAYSIALEEMTGEQVEQSMVVKMCDPSDERLRKYGGKAFAVYPRYALDEDEEMFLTRLKMYRYNENFISPKE